MLALALPPLVASAGNTGWVAAASMSTPRANHTATLLPSGKVLVVGGDVGPLGRLATAELYDPAANRWTSAGSMSTPRHFHTATLLGTGKVLVAGGSTGPGGILASAELYDPAKNQWSKAASMSAPRAWAAAALLNTGKVLVAGGIATGAGIGLASAELYDPSSNGWSSAGTMNVGRQEGSTLTVLQNGKVLVVGESQPQLYDADANSWASAGAMGQERIKHVAIRLQDGHVLVAGGVSRGLNVMTAELYDAVTNSWSSAAEMPTLFSGMTAVLLKDGTVLLAGGTPCSPIGCAPFPAPPSLPCPVTTPATTCPTIPIATTFYYQPSGNAWTVGASRIAPRTMHTATALKDGDVLVAGGVDASRGVMDSAKRLLSPTSTYNRTAASPAPEASATWQPAATMHFARFGHTATLLKDGRVLVVGGTSTPASGTDRIPGLSSAEIYDPSTNLWSVVASMQYPRHHHTATPLDDGRVLVVGGSSSSAFGTNAVFPFAEIYDPKANTWAGVAQLPLALKNHTATLLKTGKVLVVGGDGLEKVLAAAFLFDPSAGTWSAAASMTSPRDSHTATLLQDGRVLVAGGGASLASAEIYDPGTDIWAPAAAMASGRTRHTANLLPTGKVLVAGGQGDSGPLASAELYDPSANAWSAAGSMDAAREGQTSTTLPDGQVVGMCGGGPGPDAPSAEVYDPSTNTWTAASAGTGTSAEGHSTTLLPNGTLLVAGGQVGSKAVAGASVVRVRPLSVKGNQVSPLTAYLKPIVGFIAVLVLVIVALGVFIARRVMSRRGRGI